MILILSAIMKKIMKVQKEKYNNKNSSKKSDKFKTLSQKYKTLSNNSLTNSKYDGNYIKLKNYKYMI